MAQEDDRNGDPEDTFVTELRYCGEDLVKEAEVKMVVDKIEDRKIDLVNETKSHINTPFRGVAAVC